MNVSVSNPPDNVELFASVDLVIQTVSNTASKSVVIAIKLMQDVDNN